jgi:hypothetical protein
MSGTIALLSGLLFVGAICITPIGTDNLLALTCIIIGSISMTIFGSMWMCTYEKFK